MVGADGASKRLPPLAVGKALLAMAVRRIGCRQAEDAVMVCFQSLGVKSQEVVVRKRSKAGGIRCRDEGEASCSGKFGASAHGLCRVSAGRSGLVPKHPLEFLLNNSAGEHPS